MLNRISVNRACALPPALAPSLYCALSVVAPIITQMGSSNKTQGRACSSKQQAQLHSSFTHKLDSGDDGELAHDVCEERWVDLGLHHSVLEVVEQHVLGLQSPPRAHTCNQRVCATKTLHARMSA